MCSVVRVNVMTQASARKKSILSCYVCIDREISNDFHVYCLHSEADKYTYVSFHRDCFSSLVRRERVLKISTTVVVKYSTGYYFWRWEVSHFLCA